MSTSLVAALAAFPGALPVARFLDDVDRLLAPRGFAPENTLAMVSSCRDELAHPLPQAVAARMGLSFNLGGLGGLPSLGRTGWMAGLSHVPDSDGRGHLVVIGMTHVGFGPDGTPGESLRRQQSRPTTTCGALVAILNDAAIPQQPDPEDLVGDYEKERLRRLLAEVDPTPAADVLDITRRAAVAVELEMWRELESIGAWRTMDVAVFCGVQLHVHDAPDHVAVTSAQIQLADGSREPLDG